jgi:hypothetical protein
MSTIYYYVEGDTEAIVMQLLSNGLVPAQPLTGEPTITVRNQGGTLIPTTGKTAIVDAAEWLVSYNPAAGDLLETGGTHRYHWTVDQDGVKFSFPGGPADHIEVSKRGGGRVGWR